VGVLTSSARKLGTGRVCVLVRRSAHVRLRARPTLGSGLHALASEASNPEHVEDDVVNFLGPETRAGSSCSVHVCLALVVGIASSSCFLYWRRGDPRA
jgi:hypothetical protein